MDDVYRNIQYLRVQNDLTQDELAQKVGYTSGRSMVAKIEAGKVNLTVDKIVDFAKALNVTPEFLLGWDENEYTLTEEESFVIDSMRKDKCIHDRILGYVQAFEDMKK